MVFFTSDLHLGHENAIYHASRPYKSLNEMESTLIGHINEVVKSQDELWILGDFSYKINQDRIRELRMQI